MRFLWEVLKITLMQMIGLFFIIMVACIVVLPPVTIVMLILSNISKVLASLGLGKSAWFIISIIVFLSFTFISNFIDLKNKKRGIDDEIQ